MTEAYHVWTVVFVIPVGELVNLVKELVNIVGQLVHLVLHCVRC